MQIIRANEGCLLTQQDAVSISDEIFRFTCRYEELGVWYRMQAGSWYVAGDVVRFRFALFTKSFWQLWQHFALNDHALPRSAFIGKIFVVPYRKTPQALRDIFSCRFEGVFLWKWVSLHPLCRWASDSPSPDGCVGRWQGQEGRPKVSDPSLMLGQLMDTAPKWRVL